MPTKSLVKLEELPLEWKSSYLKWGKMCMDTSVIWWEKMHSQVMPEESLIILSK